MGLGLRPNPICTPYAFPLPLTLTPSKQGGGVRGGRNGIEPYTSERSDQQTKTAASVYDAEMIGVRPNHCPFINEYQNNTQKDIKIHKKLSRQYTNVT